MKYSDLLLSIVLVALGLWSMRRVTDTAAAAALAGALFGGAAVLLGNWINRTYESRRALDDLGRRRSSLEKLITAELVTTAVGYLNAKREMDIALSPGALVSNGFAPVLSAVSQHLPRGMPRTSGLGTELLMLEESAIDALVTFQGCQAMTGLNVDQLIGSGPIVGRLAVMGINQLIAHDMGILAECFEHIAPKRELQMPDKQPEFGTLLGQHTHLGIEAGNGAHQMQGMRKGNFERSGCVSQLRKARSQNNTGRKGLPLGDCRGWGTRLDGLLRRQPRGLETGCHTGAGGTPS